MTALDITEIIRHNTTHQYHLMNSYVFPWESDVFCVSKSGLIYEFEIKLSRSDYRADFKKVDKHRMLKAASEGSKHYIRRRGLWFKATRWEQHRKSFTTALEPDEEYYSNIELLYTDIAIKELFVPHKFVYVCPKDLIKKEEVPDYAGLYYVDNSSFRMVKRPPKIHSINYEMRGILLHKFYYLSIKQATELRSLRYQMEALNKNEGQIITAYDDFKLTATQEGLKAV